MTADLEPLITSLMSRK